MWNESSSKLKQIQIITKKQQTAPPSKMKMKTEFNIQESSSQKCETKIQPPQPARPRPSLIIVQSLQRAKILAPKDQNGHCINATTRESKNWTSGKRRIGISDPREGHVNKRQRWQRVIFWAPGKQCTPKQTRSGQPFETKRGKRPTLGRYLDPRYRQCRSTLDYINNRKSTNSICRKGMPRDTPQRVLNW